MKSSNKKTARKNNELEQVLVTGMVAKELLPEAEKIVSKKSSKKVDQLDVADAVAEKTESDVTLAEGAELQSLDIQVAYQATDAEALDIELTQNKDDKGGAVVNKDDGGWWWLGGLGLLGGIAALAGGGGGGSAPVVRDTDGPDIASVPQDDSVSVLPDTTLTVVFDEVVRRGSGKLQLWLVGNDSGPVEEIDVSEVNIGLDGKTVTFIPLNLAEGNDYYLTIDDGTFVDLEGNVFEGLSDQRVFNFSTIEPTIVRFRHADFENDFGPGAGHGNNSGDRDDDVLELDSDSNTIIEVNLVGPEHDDNPNVFVDTSYDGEYLQQVIDFNRVENMSTFRLNVSEDDRVRLSIELRDLDEDTDFERVEINVDGSSDLLAFNDLIRTHNFGTNVELLVTNDSLVDAGYHVVHVSTDAVVTIEASDGSSEITGGDNVVVVNEDAEYGDGDNVDIDIKALNGANIHVSQVDESDSLDATSEIDTELVLVNGLNPDINLLASGDAYLSVDGIAYQDLDDGGVVSGHAYLVDVNQSLDSASGDYIDVEVSVHSQFGGSVFAWVTADIDEAVGSGDESIDDITSVSLNSSIISIDTTSGSIDGGSLAVELKSEFGSRIGVLNNIDVSYDVYGHATDSLDADPDFDNSISISNIDAVATGSQLYFGDVNGSLDAITLLAEISSDSTISTENRLHIDIDTSTVDNTSSSLESDVIVSAVCMDATISRLWVDDRSELEVGSIDIHVSGTDEFDDLISARNSLDVSVVQNGDYSSDLTLDNVRLDTSVVDIQLSNNESIDIGQIGVVAEGFMGATNSANIGFYTGSGDVGVTDLSLDAVAIRVESYSSDLTVDDIDINLGFNHHDSVDSWGNISSLMQGEDTTLIVAGNLLSLDISVADNSYDLLNLSNINLSADLVRIDLGLMEVDPNRLPEPINPNVDIGTLNISIDGGFYAVQNILSAGESVSGYWGTYSSDNEIYIDGQDAEIAAQLDASNFSIQTSASSVNISSDLNYFMSVDSQDVNNVFEGNLGAVATHIALNGFAMEILSDANTCSDSDVDVTLDLDARIIDLTNSSLESTDTGDILSENNVTFGGLTLAVNSVDLNIDGQDPAPLDSLDVNGSGFDISIDANASMIDVSGGNPQVSGYFSPVSYLAMQNGPLSFYGDSIVGNAVRIQADSGQYDYTDSSDIDLSTSLVSIDATGQNTDVDAHLTTVATGVVASNDVEIGLYSYASIDNFIDVSSDLIRVSIDDTADYVSIGVASILSSYDICSDASDLGLAAVNHINTVTIGDDVDVEIGLDQHGITLTGDVAALNMSHQDYLESLDFSGLESLIFSSSRDIGGVLAAANGSVDLSADISNTIYASDDIESNVDVDSYLVSLDISTESATLDVTAVYSSEIETTIYVTESMDAGGDVGSYIEVDAAMLDLSVDFADYDESAELTVNVVASVSSEITSSVEIHGSYEAEDYARISLDIENTFMSLELIGASTDTSVKINLEAEFSSSLDIATLVDLHVGSYAYDDTADVSMDFKTSLLSLDVDDYEGSLQVDISAIESSDINVMTSFEVNAYSSNDVDISIDADNTLISLDQEDGESPVETHLSVVVRDDSNIRVLTDSYTSADASGDIYYEVDVNTMLISIDAEDANGQASIDIDLSVLGNSHIDVNADHSSDLVADEKVEYRFEANTHGLSLDASDTSADIDVEMVVCLDSSLHICTDHSAIITSGGEDGGESSDIYLSVDIENTLISIESNTIQLSSDVFYGVYNSSDDTYTYTYEDLGPDVSVTVDGSSDIRVIGRSELDLSGSSETTSWISIDADISIDAVGISIDADGAYIDLEVTRNSNFVVGAEVSDRIYPNNDGEFTTGGDPVYGDIDVDYELQAHVISIDGDYATIDILVSDDSLLEAYTSYDSNLNEVDETRGLYTHSVDIREDSNIIAINGSFSTITMNVSDDSRVEAGSIISIDGWGNDIQISVFDGSRMIANEGDVVQIEFYATPDRDISDDIRENVFGSDITITVDDSYLSANDDVIDVGAHSTDVHFVATNSALIEADGSLIKLNGKHQSVDVELTYDASVDIDHDENMIEIIGNRASVNLDMSYGSRVAMDGDHNLDDRNVIDIQGRFATVTANIGSASADQDEVLRGVSIDDSQDNVAISADDFIEIDGGNAHVDVVITNNSGLLDFSDEFIEVKGDFASVDLSIIDSSNIYVSDDLVVIDGDFSNTSVEIENSILAAETIANIQGDAYELKVYVDDSSLDIRWDFVEVTSESTRDINAGYLSIDIYDSYIDIGEDLLDIYGDDNHATVLVHSSELDISEDVFNISGDHNTVLATFISVDFDGVDDLLEIGGISGDSDNNNVNVTFNNIRNSYVGFDVDVDGDDNYFELNLSDYSSIEVNAYIDGDDNHVSVDLNEDSTLSLDLYLDVGGSDDFDIALNVERESQMDFRLAFGSYDDSGTGNISLDLTLNDGSRVNGYVYLADSMDLDFTTNAHDHDHNSHIWFSLDQNSSMTVDHLDTNRNEDMDLRYTGYNAELYLESNDNYDRIHIEGSDSFDVWGFTEEDTLMIDGHSFSWHEVSDTSLREDWSGDSDNEWNHVDAANDSSADTIFLFATDENDYWEFDDVQAAVDDIFDNSGDYRDLYFVITDDCDDDSYQDDIELWRFDYETDTFKLSTTLYDASQYFDTNSEKFDSVVTGYLNNYVL